MSLFYKFAYSIGLTPWEMMPSIPTAKAQVISLFEREERERQAPFGAALDVGCGSAYWTVTLAQRGWRVTGIDIVAKAIRRGQARVRQAGVTATLMQGDLTSMDTSVIGSGFSFVLDLGAIHGLTVAQQKLAGEGISAVSAADATLLLLAFTPGNRGPLPHGMSRDDIHAAFPKWKIVDETSSQTASAPAFIRRAKPSYFRLRRQ